MKNRKIALWVGLVIVVVLVIVLIVVNVNKGNANNDGALNKPQEEFTKEEPNGNKVNTSDTLKKDRQSLGYSIKNIELKMTDGQTVFSLDLVNDTAKEMPSKLVNIIFLDKNGNEVSKMALYIRNIKANSKITTQATINNDFTNVYDFKLEERK